MTKNEQQLHYVSPEVKTIEFKIRAMLCESRYSVDDPFGNTYEEEI